MTDKVLERAADFVAPFEGFEPETYVCPGGVLSFGYGSLLKHYPSVELPITKERAKVYLMKDLASALLTVDRLVDVRLNINQTVALVSFVHNVGSGAFERSTLLKVLNQGNYTQAAEEFSRWNKAKGVTLRGLIRRREAERDLFLTPVSFELKSMSHQDFLEENLSFEGISGYYKACIMKHVFNIGKGENKKEWEGSLAKAQFYLDQLKKLSHKL